MAIIDLHFPVQGATLATDHAYGLYSALSRLLPSLHQDNQSARIGPINGRYTGNGILSLDPRLSRLRFRLPAEEIPLFLPLAGKPVEIHPHTIRLGVPHVFGLVPAPNLIARMVTIKGFKEPAEFLVAARRQLEAIGVSAEPAIPFISAGKHEGEPRRHVLRIKDKKVVGFSVQITGLTADQSIKVQEHGLGGRKKMGCGFFVPMRKENR